MELNENAEIDTRQVEDRRGVRSRRRVVSGPVGGGGLVGVIITIIVVAVGVYLGFSDSGEGHGGVGAADIQQACSQDGAIQKLECRNVLYVNSIQAYWREAMPEYFDQDYRQTKTVIFSERVDTRCGTADSGVGPFYCPTDKQIYIDFTFYEVLARDLGAPGEFAQPYVLAHEYGHHIQELTGQEGEISQAQNSDISENALSVKLELQADCFAGVWAKAATGTTDAKGQKIFKSLTEQDIQEGVQAAGQIGDDTLQERAGNPVNPKEFTHGTAEQRQQSFRRGYDTGNPDGCAASSF
ncbi:neutral zinc metallopeptidase [Actinoplanes sp. TRM 88003]|uniref:Neutral zinc metallopeptidase n=1 Tax=Paractinoplanes aksuensis TaxID=2939490 RepID=A0ABT1E0R0_9ACTN|nr:neutral zinc metallopeptidase [Actinoplanes aksuensis]MCO8275441.1 neutral zinc metallopeptidase [Actinoplanes aksuensis]